MITPTGALILLVCVLPIAIWAALNDLKTLKIPNKASLALAGVWLAVGWLAVPTWTAWFWGFGLLAIGFLLAYLAFALFNFPGGDSKYAAAMSPIFVGADILYVMLIFLVGMVAATLLHQVARKLPVVRRLTPGWKGLEHWRMIPFGLALSGILIFYLVAAIWPQV
jgi:prepilin peptidase CpaA